MPKKTQIRFTNKVKEFILDKMAEGYDIAQMCRKWGDQLPNPKSIYRKAIDDQEFAEQVNQAYAILLMHRMDELHEIASQTASEAYPDLDWREAEATLKRRIDESKFVLGKMAPILSKKFDKASKIEVEGLDNGPQIAVINYFSEQTDTPKTIPAAEIISSKINELESDQ